VPVEEEEEEEEEDDGHPVHWTPCVRYFVCNKPKVIFIHSSNHTEQCRK
jgi:hypothetical protein